MSMKRSREAEEITTTANSLLLLSTMSSTPSSSSSSFEYSNTNMNRMFTCKTCNKKFLSFQALGGHRASHKKPRFSNDDQVTIQQPPKPKVHECSICGLEFSIGQALGGHMRRHRQVASSLVDDDGMILSLSPPNYYHNKDSVAKKKVNGGANRVLCLDLNLTPSENQFVFGQIASLIC